MEKQRIRWISTLTRSLRYGSSDLGAVRFVFLLLPPAIRSMPCHSKTEEERERVRVLGSEKLGLRQGQGFRRLTIVCVEAAHALKEILTAEARFYKGREGEGNERTESRVFFFFEVLPSANRAGFLQDSNLNTLYEFGPMLDIYSPYEEKF